MCHDSGQRTKVMGGNRHQTNLVGAQPVMTFASVSTTGKLCQLTGTEASDKKRSISEITFRIGTGSTRPTRPHVPPRVLRRPSLFITKPRTNRRHAPRKRGCVRLSGCTPIRGPRTQRLPRGAPSSVRRLWDVVVDPEQQRAEPILARNEV